MRVDANFHMYLQKIHLLIKIHMLRNRWKFGGKRKKKKRVESRYKELVKILF